jgi:hypothetical protein
MATKTLQTWGLERDGRLLSLAVVCEPHARAAVAMARATPWCEIDPAQSRWVRLEHLDPIFAACHLWVCFGCELSKTLSRAEKTRRREQSKVRA